MKWCILIKNDNGKMCGKPFDNAISEIKLFNRIY